MCSCDFGVKEPSTEEITTSVNTDPLPSWNEGSTKSAIIDFVNSVTDESSTSFVPPEDRIATFDNDGNLWAEQPVYFQIQFSLDQIKAMAIENPELAKEEPYKSVINDDIDGILASGKKRFITNHGKNACRYDFRRFQ